MNRNSDRLLPLLLGSGLNMDFVALLIYRLSSPEWMNAIMILCVFINAAVFLLVMRELRDLRDSP